MSNHQDDNGQNDTGSAAGGTTAGRDAVVKEFTVTGRGKKCPICRNPVQTANRPFCSKRCADQDLGRWFREDYRIPTAELPDGDEEDQDIEDREDRDPEY